MAEYSWASIANYMLGALFFFLPMALVKIPGGKAGVWTLPSWV